MPDNIYIGQFTHGLKNVDRAFAIDNDAFPTLFNMYIWRKRAKRKRGTLPLGRLQVQQVSVQTPTLTWQINTIFLLNGAGNHSAESLLSKAGAGTGATIVPGSINITDNGGGNVYSDASSQTGTINGSVLGVATINYITGNFSIAGGTPGGAVTGTFSYYPGLPVIGLEDVVPNNGQTQFPILMAFDNLRSYGVNQLGVPFFYVTSYYKGTNTPFTWTAPDSQLFWSTNYQSAFWVTNNKSGLHLLNGVYVAGSPGMVITFTFTQPAFGPSPAAPFTTLIIGDQLWFNEWPAVASPAVSPNGLVGVVSNVALAGVGTYQVTFNTAVTVSGTGIVQMLTNTLPGQDGIRWYDGDPTSGTGLPTGTGLGWVNFAPPLTATSTTVNDQASELYYLVGALAILPFKDRLLFFAPQIQTSSGAVIQLPLQDTVLWSWNGTPYYNSLVPTNPTNSETFDPSAYYVDQTGKGGYLPAGIAQPITTVMNNEDVLLIGFAGTGKKTRFVYTGNDLQPFVFYLINSELPSSCTFSSVVLDRGGIDIGIYGITITTQQSCARIDLDIPDDVFEIQAANSGLQRVNAIRDFQREWIYFSYPVGNGSASQGSWVYPTQTFLFNYRDNTWSILYENFTRHGYYRSNTGFTWATCPFQSWDAWNEPWNSGSAEALFPSVIAGNPQGYVIIISEGTGETQSGAIFAIANDGLGNTQITSYNHCVSEDDYLYFSDALGSTFINGVIGRVLSTADANTFVVDIPYVSSTYIGLGQFTRLSQPLLQTKQFPIYWEQGRQVRIGPQRYLFDVTANGQVTIGISLSQDPENFWNDGPIVPANDVENTSLVYSQTVFTSPETNNLQQLVGQPQLQMWHRMNTSLQGDTFQIGVTLNDTQMRNLEYATSEISLHGMHLQVSPGPLLA